MESGKTLIGTLIFLPSNVGSKSEAVLPYLYRSRTEAPVRVLLKRDNPFENKGFDAYDGCHVALCGDFAPSGTFIVETVTIETVPVETADTPEEPETAE